MDKKDTLVIMTGGTIDAEPYADPANPPVNATPLDNSLVSQAISELGFAERCNFLKWRAKDSKAFTSAEMDDLAQIIRTSPAKYVIITHGTDAMAEHSRQIAGRLQYPDDKLGHGHQVNGSGRKRIKQQQTVIFTGAMIPLANGPESDGYQNLRFIFEHMDGWEPGVRVAMQGKCFEPVGLDKDFGTRTFRGREIGSSPQGARTP